MAKIGIDLEQARAHLANGELVAIPTETVYGLAGNALNERAVASIFEVKQRPSFDPLIVHTNSLGKVRGFVNDIPETALTLAAEFWPGPLTMILKRKPLIPDLVTSGLDTVAVRIPRHPITLQLLEKLDFPLAAPSANPFGYVSPTTAAHVEAQLGAKIPYILDGGASHVGVESTIVSFEGEVPTVLRLGGLSVEDLERCIGKVKVNPHSSSQPVAPGMLKSHYAPRKTFELIDSPKDFKLGENKHIAVLGFDTYLAGVDRSAQRLLSPQGDLNEAASRLFGFMRELDEVEGLEKIVALKVPNEGLGRAINDRLSRAAAKG